MERTKSEAVTAPEQELRVLEPEQLGWRAEKRSASKMFEGGTMRNFQSGVKADCKVLELSNWKVGVATDPGEGQLNSGAAGS